jgi:GTP-binding protein
MFVDRVRIWARAGDGGDGCCSFRREKYVDRGGPDGGDGGKGGDVIVRVNHNLNNLLHIKYKPHLFASHGKNGSKKKCTGAGGKQILIEVPPGTCIYRIPTSEENFERAGDDTLKELVADLTQTGEEFVLCAGGQGGRGNQHFKSSINQAPRRADPGQPGEKGQYVLELKSIADVGLVGFPNAGKSSLLGVLSAAHPKVAPYPFTTLEPVIGVIEFENYGRMTMADIPGLVEGAHEGVGLGHDFLRHVERCKVLVFVVDMAGTEGRDPLDDYRLIRKEISLYQKELSKRPYFVVANKMDLPEAVKNAKRFQKSFKIKPLCVSTQEKTGLDDLKKKLLSFVE